MSAPGSPAPIYSPVLLDTNVFSALLFGGPDVTRYDTAVSGRETLLSSFSQGEVLAGAAMREWGPRRMDELEKLLSRMVLLEVTDDVVRSYASVRAEAKRIGHPLHGPSQVDRPMDRGDRAGLPGAAADGQPQALRRLSRPGARRGCVVADQGAAICRVAVGFREAAPRDTRHPRLPRLHARRSRQPGPVRRPAGASRRRRSELPQSGAAGRLPRPVNRAGRRRLLRDRDLGSLGAGLPRAALARSRLLGQVGSVFDEAPSWATGRRFWAPQISWSDGRFVVLFAGLKRTADSASARPPRSTPAARGRTKGRSYAGRVGRSIPRPWCARTERRGWCSRQGVGGGLFAQRVDLRSFEVLGASVPLLAPPGLRARRHRGGHGLQGGTVVVSHVLGRGLLQAAVRLRRGGRALRRPPRPIRQARRPGARRRRRVALPGARHRLPAR